MFTGSRVLHLTSEKLNCECISTRALPLPHLPHATPHDKCSIFHHSSASVYYTEYKPENKKNKNRRGPVMRVTQHTRNLCIVISEVNTDILSMTEELNRN